MAFVISAVKLCEHSQYVRVLVGWAVNCSRTWLCLASAKSKSSIWIALRSLTSIDSFSSVLWVWYFRLKFYEPEIGKLNPKLLKYRARGQLVLLLESWFDSEIFKLGDKGKTWKEFVISVSTILSAVFIVLCAVYLWQERGLENVQDEERSQHGLLPEF
ncbi:hypothetical protein ABKV19_000326 [Rosa sericea]